MLPWTFSTSCSKCIVCTCVIGFGCSSLVGLGEISFRNPLFGPRKAIGVVVYGVDIAVHNGTIGNVLPSVYIGLACGVDEG